ncbi:MAG: hypothetical protein R3B45_04420 [Bdellovibrionota bacterium]
MKIQLLVVICFLFLTTFIPLARAEFETHGGDAVVCFTIPIVEATVLVVPPNGRLITEGGYRAISSIETLESFQARLNLQSHSVLSELDQYDENLESLKFLTDQWKVLPEFYDLIIEQRNTIGTISESGLPAQFGINDIQDSDFQLGVPSNCSVIQLAMQRFNEVYYDARLWKHLSAGQKSILQLHEEIYRIGFMKFDHQNSLRTRELIVKMLQTNSKHLDELFFQKQTSFYGFDKYLLRSIFVVEFMRSLELVKSLDKLVNDYYKTQDESLLLEVKEVFNNLAFNGYQGDEGNLPGKYSEKMGNLYFTLLQFLAVPEDNAGTTLDEIRKTKEYLQYLKSEYVK